MSWKLNPEELTVTSFETSVAGTLVMEYTPDCCTENGSGCETGPEVTCDTREHNCATDDPAVCPVGTAVTVEQVDRIER